MDDYVAISGAIYGVWRKTFAWFPVYLTDTKEWVWLTRVWMKPLYWVESEVYASCPVVDPDAVKTFIRNF